VSLFFSEPENKPSGAIYRDILQMDNSKVDSMDFNPTPENLKGSYEKDPLKIYELSFAVVRNEAPLHLLPCVTHDIAIRMIHACGMVDLPQDLSFSENVVDTAREALQGGYPILCDCSMVAAGINHNFLKARNDVIVTLNHSTVSQMAKDAAITRSAAAVDLWKPHIENAVVVIGNAPTALFRLLENIRAGWPLPSVILGFPVGFVGARESKSLLVENIFVPFIALHGRRGGSAIAAACVNALAAGLETG
jgi:precorrin isomerase